MPHGGYSKMYLRESAFGEKENRTAQGFHAGIKLNLYLGRNGYFLMNTNYTEAKLTTDFEKLNVGGFRFQVGLGTHIRLFGEKRENGINRTLSFYKFNKSFYIGTFKNMNIAAFSRVFKK